MNTFKLTASAALLTLILIISSAHGQAGMKNSQSQSQVIRDTNPKIINSVGKIAGNEVPRGDVSPGKNAQAHQEGDRGVNTPPTPVPGEATSIPSE